MPSSQDQPTRPGTQPAHQSSDARKSLQSARIMSFTPGSSTIELMGRFWRAPFHRQQPYVLQEWSAAAYADEEVGQRGPGVRVRASYVRVGHEDVHAVLCVLLVVALRLEHEPLEDVVVPRDDAV